VSNVLKSSSATLVTAAATAAGLPSGSLAALFAALPLGSAALAEVPGITTEIMAAAGAAYQQAYVHALRTTALSSLSFGVIAIIACICCNDIGHKVCLYRQSTKVKRERMVNIKHISSSSRGFAFSSLSPPSLKIS
jgi:predicted secreted protein